MALSSMRMLASDQHDSPLFKLPPELRNNIYNLVFAPTTNDDSTITLDGAKPPAKALISTCQLIYHESRGIYKTAFREYCKHEFVIHKYRGPQCACGPRYETLGNEVLLHITRIRVVFDGSICYNGRNPWWATVNLSKKNPSRAVWKAASPVHGTSCHGLMVGENRRAVFAQQVVHSPERVKKRVRTLGRQAALTFNIDLAVTKPVVSFR